MPPARTLYETKSLWRSPLSAEEASQARRSELALRGSLLPTFPCRELPAFHPARTFPGPLPPERPSLPAVGSGMALQSLWIRVNWWNWGADDPLGPPTFIHPRLF